MDKKFLSIFPSNDKSYLQNAIFNPQKKEEWYPFFVKLKKNLRKKNIEINTYDISTDISPYRYVFLDLPYPWKWSLSTFRLLILNRKRNILICTEPPFIIPFNYMKIFHPFFLKIYTWNDRLVDNKKYFKFCLPKSNLGINTQAKAFKDKKFLILINANKLPFYPFQLLSSFGKELYSERIKAIDFFEKNIPNFFSLYGKGWNKPKKYSLKEKFFGFKKYLTYQGEADDKVKLLSHYKYCLCFENMTNADGYITEKIFDCFKAKCVPVYWGASNIEKYIPKNCFIDFRDFSNYDKLLTFLVSIDENKYNRYIKNIEKLLADKKFTDFWSEKGFLNFFIKDILEIKKKQYANKSSLVRNH
ncbi:hypothetical protein HYW43_02540 [Candidatus Daviesbacteria bacterium]|nr:hypothetical protein [Candidatus Daviesbacteria bacterium]